MLDYISRTLLLHHLNSKLKSEDKIVRFHLIPVLSQMFVLF